MFSLHLKYNKQIWITLNTAEHQTLTNNQLNNYDELIRFAFFFLNQVQIKDNNCQINFCLPGSCRKPLKCSLDSDLYNDSLIKLEHLGKSLGGFGCSDISPTCKTTAIPMSM